MPKEVEECVDSILQDNPDYSDSKAWAICQSQQNKQDDTSDVVGKAAEEVESLVNDNDLSKDEAWSVVIASRVSKESDSSAVKSVAYRQLTGEWGDLHPAEKTKDGREHLLSSYLSKVESILNEYQEARKAVRDNDSVDQQPHDETADEEADTQNLLDDEQDADDVDKATVDKSIGRHTVKFKMESSRGFVPIFKGENGDMLIWGPASVEIVDKEGDRITAKALEEALPQLLKRQRLSLEHSDQLVGEILEGHETDSPITVEVDGKQFKRDSFPTAVLELDDMEPALYVCGKIWDDTRQSRQAQKDIQDGKLDSYSISGESIVATSKYEDGELVNDINELDLSAVTLCEEGMNQKAKFGVVQKADGDVLKTDDSAQVEATTPSGRGPAGIHAKRYIRIVKHMTNEETNEETQKTEDESVSGTPSEVVSLDDIREEFKSIVNEALPEDDLATKTDITSKEDLESLIEEKSLSKEDVRGIAKETAEDVVKAAFAAKAEEEKGEDIDEVEDPDDDGEEEVDFDPASDDDEVVDDEEKGDVEDEVVPDEEPELDDDDDEVVEEVEAPEEDDFPEEEFEEEKAGYSHEELAEMLPEDLFDAVREYLDEEPGMDEESVDEPFEMSDEEVETPDSVEEKSEGTDDVDAYLEKEFADEFELDSPSGPSPEIVKSWQDEDDDEAEQSQVGPAAQAFYE